MKHLALAHDRLRSMSVGFGSNVGGHVVLLNLLKRWQLVTQGQRPETVEAEWGENYGRLWHELADQALAQNIGMMHATREQLWRMAKSLVAGLAKRDDGRIDWYPDGWQAMAELVVSGKPKKERRARPVRAADTMDMSEKALQWVAESKGMTQEAVLSAAGLERPLRAEHETALLDMMRASGEVARRAAGGGA